MDNSGSKDWLLGVSSGRAGGKKAHESAYYTGPLKFNLQPVSGTPLIRGNMRAAILPTGEFAGQSFQSSKVIINLITASALPFGCWNYRASLAISAEF